MNKPRLRAYLCSGPNCGPKGSRALADFLERELEGLGLSESVSVASTGCQAHCESGPTMVVYPGPVYYQGVNEARLRRIVREHFIAGEPVKEYFWSGVRRRILPDGSKPVIPIQPRAGSRPATQQPKPKAKPIKPSADVDDFKW